jgi:BirA family biotin operon repressor/biotin-[acetyl-CoA-carboxylase] ligase
MKLKGQNPEYIVIGVGINVNQKKFPPELGDKATSLALEIGEEADRIEGIARIMECFEENYKKFLRTKDLSLMKEDYESLLLNKDQQVRILEKNSQWQGTARGINDRGELLVEDSHGNLREILSGEVSVRGLYSYV